MILDTCFLIDLLKRDEGAVAKAKELDKKEVPVFTTTISVFELWQGVYDAKEEEQEKVLQLLSAIGLHVLDFEAAKHAAELFATLRRQGQSLDPEDCLIAGVACAHNETLMTRNVKHFSRMKELKIESY